MSSELNQVPGSVGVEVINQRESSSMSNNSVSSRPGAISSANMDQLSFPSDIFDIDVGSKTIHLKDGWKFDTYSVVDGAFAQVDPTNSNRIVDGGNANG